MPRREPHRRGVLVVGCGSLGSCSARFAELVGCPHARATPPSVSTGWRPKRGRFVMEGAGRGPTPGRFGRKSASQENRGRSTGPYPAPTRSRQGSDHDQSPVPCQRVRPGPGLREGLLHREARFRGPIRHLHGRGVRRCGRGSGWLTVGTKEQPDLQLILASCDMGRSPDAAGNCARWWRREGWRSGSCGRPIAAPLTKSCRKRGYLSLRAGRAALWDGGHARRLGQPDQPQALEFGHRTD